MARRALDPVRDRTKVFDHPTRRAVARLCRQSPQTIYGMQRRLGRPDGELREIVKRLHGWGVLKETPESTKTRRVYSFDHAWDDDLTSALRRHTPIWFEGQQVLLVRPHGVSAAFKRLASSDDQRLQWGIALRDGRGLVLGLDEQLSNADAEALSHELSTRTGSCELTTVDQVLPASELAAHAARASGHTQDS